MLSIDGSFGEGGGQILRSALTASLLTGRPFTITRIRAGRRHPGLRRQHLTAVHAAAEVSGGEAAGATMGSDTLVFRPGRARAGKFHFSTGTAGSTGLVLQTILLPLLQAGHSEVVIDGGTHNEGAPPFDFLDRAFIPLLRLMGADVDLDLERMGFAPAGGGRIRLRTGPGRWTPLRLLRRGAIESVTARAIVSRLPISIAERELAVVRRELGWPGEALQPETADSPGPGNILVLVVESDRVTEVFTGFGRRGVPAEAVARHAVESTARYLRAGVPVGPHLADQLLLPMVHVGGGSFLTVEPTAHFHTNAFVIRRFYDVELTVARENDDQVRVDCRSP